MTILFTLFCLFANCGQPADASAPAAALLPHVAVLGQDLSSPPPRAPRQAASPSTPWVCNSRALEPRYEPTYFVSTSGDDGNSGRSEGDAFRTLQRAADVVEPGDVVWVRGGIYPSDVSFQRSGTSDRPIVVESYPGECAILDGTGLSAAQKVRFEGADFYVFRNFVVRNNREQGILLMRSSDNVISNVMTHDNGLSGIQSYSGDRNRFSYFVSFNNSDGRAGDADGIGLSAGRDHRIEHCVVFRNSDDGIDTWRSVGSVVENCVSFENGYQGGDGHGIKAGGNDETVNTVVRFNVSFSNKVDGFTFNSGRNVTFEHNTAYANGRYGFIAANAVLRNNLAYRNGTDAFRDEGGNDTEANSWELGIDDPSFLETDPYDPDFLAPAGGSRVEGRAEGRGASNDLGAVPVGETIESFLGVPLGRILGR